MQALASVSGPLRARQAQLPRAAAAARAGQGVAACHALMRTPRCRGMQRGCVPGHVVGGRRAPGAPSNDGRATRLRPRYSTTRGSPSSSSCSGTPLASAMPAGRLRVSTPSQQSHSSCLHALGSGCGLLEGSHEPGPRPSFGARCRGQRCMGQVALPRKRVREHAHTTSSQTCHLGGRAPSSAVPPSCSRGAAERRHMHG